MAKARTAKQKAASRRNGKQNKGSGAGSSYIDSVRAAAKRTAAKQAELGLTASQMNPAPSKKKKRTVGLGALGDSPRKAVSGTKVKKAPVATGYGNTRLDCDRRAYLKSMGAW